MRRTFGFFALLLGLLAVIILFAVLTGSPESYLSATNLRVVLAQTVIVAIGALGMTLVIISGDWLYTATQSCGRDRRG